MTPQICNEGVYSITMGTQNSFCFGDQHLSAINENDHDLMEVHGRVWLLGGLMTKLAPGPLPFAHEFAERMFPHEA